MADRPNVVLLSIDALRADHLSCHGYERETTPVIDSLAEENAWFKRAYSSSSHTREAVPSLLTGRYPDEFADHGYSLFGDSIGEMLQENGYETAGFHSNPYISRAYGFGDGFDTFDDDLYLGDSKLLALGQRLFDKLRNRHYARAETINERALDWLDQQNGEPFFLWNHYMDVHGPYQPPKRFRNEFINDSISNRESKRLYRRSVDDPESITEEERELQQALYDAENRYVDKQIGDFLAALKQRDHLEDTLLILTADHGDAFGERGYYGHPRKVDEELLHVPLLVRGEGVPESTIDVPAGTLDIVPTILEEVGAEYDLPGRPLQHLWTEPDEYTDRYVFSEATGINNSERLFRATGTEGHCLARANLKAKSITSSSCEGIEAESTLTQFVQKRLDEEVAVTPADDDMAEGAVEGRLEALGYKKK